MSADPRTVNELRFSVSSSEHMAQNVAENARQSAIDQRAREEASRKTPSGVTLPRESEKEKIKRQLYNLIDRVDKL